MNIKNYSWEKDKECNLGEFVTSVLISNKDGLAESANDTAERTAAALGRLIDVLANKGILSKDEIIRIVGHWSINSEVELVAAS